MKQLFSVLLAAILISLFLIDESTLSQGIYKSKAALIAGFAFINLGVNFLMYTNWLSGWAAWFTYGAIVVLGLLIPTLF